MSDVQSQVAQVLPNEQRTPQQVAALQGCKRGATIPHTDASTVLAEPQQYLFGRKMIEEESNEHIRKLKEHEYLQDPLAPLSQVSTIVRGNDPNMLVGTKIPEEKMQKMVDHMYRDSRNPPETAERARLHAQAVATFKARQEEKAQELGAGTAMSQTSVAEPHMGGAMSQTSISVEPPTYNGTTRIRVNGPGYKSSAVCDPESLSARS